jgi:hypothetical protein
MNQVYRRRSIDLQASLNEHRPFEDVQLRFYEAKGYPMFQSQPLRGGWMEGIRPAIRGSGARTHAWRLPLLRRMGWTELRFEPPRGVAA